MVQPSSEIAVTAGQRLTQDGPNRLVQTPIVRPPAGTCLFCRYRKASRPEGDGEVPAGRGNEH